MRSDLTLSAEQRIRDELALQRRLGVARRTASALMPSLQRTAFTAPQAPVGFPVTETAGSLTRGSPLGVVARVDARRLRLGGVDEATTDARVLGGKT